MKRILFLFCFFFSIAVSAQELCANGIDDDGDGLIDLNDTVDCKCIHIGGGVPASLIKNPSFEEKTACPSSYSELYKAKDWFQATSATSDYFNCSFYAGPPGLVPPPDGVAYAGGFILTDYKEYIGSCLSGPMISGTKYRVTFDIASSLLTDFLFGCPEGDPNPYGPLNITIFGAPSCTSMPVSTLLCPSAVKPEWIELGSVSYSPSVSWGKITVEFTPTLTINTIMIGAPCDLPFYPDLSGACHPYFYYDNFIVNESALFASVLIHKTGHYCTDNLVLTSVTPTVVSGGATYQWYKNGIAILGATSLTYGVPGGSPGIGDYQVMINDGADCMLSLKHNISAAPTPTLSATATPTIICIDDFSTLSVSGAKTYTWSTGSLTNSTTVSPITKTTFTVIGADSLGCKSIDSVEVDIDLPHITVSMPTICLGQSAGLNVSGANTYSWSTGSTSNVTTVTPSVTTTYTVEGTDALGCKTSETATVEVIHTLADYEGIDQSIYDFGSIINLINTSKDGVEYKWFYCDGSVSTYTDVAVTLLDSGNCCIKLAAKKLQCMDSITKCFHVNQEMFIRIPNVFTPNGDNANELFKIHSYGVIALSCAIFDRWGLKLYEWNGLDGYWDGKAKAGPAPSGTYYYIINYKTIRGDEKTEKGFLTLFRD